MSVGQMSGITQTATTHLLDATVERGDFSLSQIIHESHQPDAQSVSDVPHS